MGLSSKSSKTNSTSNTTTNLTQTPTNPAWVDSGLAGLGQQIGDLSKLDPYSLVAGPDALQTQAGTAAAGLTSSPNFGAASNMFTGVAGAATPHVQSASLLDGLSNYQNPYLNDVVNTTLTGFDDNAGRTRAQQQLDLANDSTFGGSGGSILRSLTEGQLAQQRAATEAGLRSDAFNTAAGLSNEDAARRQAASVSNAGEADNALARMLASATGLADIGTAQGADNRANIGTQASLGDMLRQIQQAHDMAPLTGAAAQAGLWNALPLNLLHGQTSNGTGSVQSTGTTVENDPIGQLSKLLAAIGSLGGGGGGGGGSGAEAAAA